MSINLNECDQACHNCVKGYFKKHRLTKKSISELGEKGDPLKIPCYGIPLTYVPEAMSLETGINQEMATSIYDPVSWAGMFLDWHCLDLDGEVWKRKTIEGRLPPGQDEYDPERVKLGKSIYHRPYQAEMLRCTSKHKVFRIGRQAGKTETLCIAILHALFTHKDWRIVVIAPYQSQIDLIFERLGTLVSESPGLEFSEIARSTKAPSYRLVIQNGSKVLGFTAGTRSGQDAGSSRGQPANMIVFDEADYLSPKDIDAAVMTITNSPKATVWMSSTPTGRREKFYETCRARDYREFHYPSSVNPNEYIQPALGPISS